jgi:hypothetical protein
MKRFVYITATIVGFMLAGCAGSPAPTSAPATALPTIGGRTATVAQPTTGAMGAAQPTNTTSSSGGGDATATPEGGNLPQPPEGDTYEFIRRAMLAQLEAKSFRATTVTEDGSGAKGTIVIEYVAPDRLRVVQGTEQEMIAIKDQGLWRKSADTEWEAQGGAAAAFMFAQIEPAAIESNLKLIDVESIQFAGTELLEGKPMFVYEYTSSLQGGNETMKANNKLWIGAVENRPYRLETSIDSPVTPGTKDKILVTYEYDLPLTIEPPA